MIGMTFEGVLIMKPRPHQITMAEEGFNILRSRGLCYNVSQERVGKSLATLLIIQKTNRHRCLILTKKAATPDWVKLTHDYPIAGKQFEVINYESAHKVKMKPDIVVLDEAHHALSAYPKPSKTLLKIGPLVYGLPLLYLSATPHAESYSQIYHQLRLSQWSPFATYKNFYRWFDAYGIPELKYLGARTVKVYTHTQEDKIKELFDPLCFGFTRKEAGFTEEAEDITHYVELSDYASELIRAITKDSLMVVDGAVIPIENAASALQKQYQVEGGTLKYETGSTETLKLYKSVTLPNREKIDFILEHFGDKSDTVIMYNYVQEEIKLKEVFKKALILQADRFAEGISLKDYKHLIIYSMSWRTSKYIQRRNRQADFTRKEPIRVHYVLVKGGISEYVYDCVAVKNKNFNARMYEVLYA